MHDIGKRVPPAHADDARAARAAKHPLLPDARLSFAMASRAGAIFVIAAALAAAAGCVAHPYWVPEGPEAYRNGYEDGCRTGANVRWSVDAVERKDKSRYRQEPDYREGWDEARTYCKENPVIGPFPDATASEQEPRTAGESRPPRQAEPGTAAVASRPANRVIWCGLGPGWSSPFPLHCRIGRPCEAMQIGSVEGVPTACVGACPGPCREPTVLWR